MTESLTSIKMMTKSRTILKIKKRTDDNRQSEQRTIEHTAHPRLLVFYKIVDEHYIRR